MARGLKLPTKPARLDGAARLHGRQAAMVEVDDDLRAVDFLPQTWLHL
jgi:hypothetical protein